MEFEAADVKYEKANTVYNIRYFVFFFFLMVWHFQLSYLTSFPVMDCVYSIGKALSFFVIIAMVFYKGSFKAPSEMFAFIILHSLLLVVSTILNRGAVVTSVITVMSLLAMYLIVHYMFLKNPVTAVNMLMFMFEVFIYANIIIMFVFPKGAYKNLSWLFGQKNVNILFVLIAICMALTYYYVHRTQMDKIRAFILIAVSVLTITMSKSATSFLGLFAFGMMLLINRKKVRFTVYHGLLISLLVFVFVVWLRQLDIFKTLIVEILHKDMTLTKRTRIWDNGLKFFLQKPILGYGVEATKVAKERFLGYETTHNKMLYTLYQGGICLYAAFIGIIITAARRLDKFREDKLGIIYTAAIVALLIQMQGESYVMTTFYFCFILVDHLPIIQEYVKDEKAA